ncbi:hypothetical protein Hanom_Chr06g00544921 [Helianthus anomalus]
MSQRQEEAVKQLGLGGLMGFVIDGIPEMAFHVVDQFDADNLTLNLGNTQLVVTATLISKFLGIYEGGLNFGAIVSSKKLHPSLKGWRALLEETIFTRPFT